MPIVRNGATAPAPRPAIGRVARDHVAHAPMHPTREVQEAQSHVIHDDPEVLAWKRPTSLDAPEPRPGYVQRWVRDPLTADAGDTNWLMKYREGWRPRPPETIPGVEAYFRGRSSQGHDIVRVGNLVLCEMPTRVWEQRRAHYDSLTVQQTATKAKSEDEAANRAGAGHGFSKIQHTDEITTSRGRTAPLMME